MDLILFILLRFTLFLESQDSCLSLGLKNSQLVSLLKQVFPPMLSGRSLWETYWTYAGHYLASFLVSLKEFLGLIYCLSALNSLPLIPLTGTMNMDLASLTIMFSQPVCCQASSVLAVRKTL